MLCPNCQTPIDDAAERCPACGAELPKIEPVQRVRTGRPKKSSGGALVAVALVGLLLLAAVGIGGVLAVRAIFSGSGEVETGTSASGDATTLSAMTGFASAEEALVAKLSEEGLADWVYESSEEGDGYVVYIAGPPASEFASQYTVSKGDGGMWSVTEAVALGFEDIEADSSADAEQAVWEYLTAVSEDRGLDAQEWTMDPFYSDSASSQVSDGGLTDYSVVGSLGEPDGSFRVQTTQTWYGSVENWEYWVVPTDAGYRIADIQPW